MADYEKIPIQENVPLTIELLYDDCRRWEASQAGWSESFTLTCNAKWKDRSGEHAVERGSLRLTAKLLTEMLRIGIGKGASVSIEKFREESHTDYTLTLLTPPETAGLWVKDREGTLVGLDGAPHHGMVGSGGVADATASGWNNTPAAAPAAQQPLGPTEGWEQALDLQQALYTECLKRAFEIWMGYHGGKSDNVDDSTLHATAASLCIPLERKGVRVPVLEPWEVDGIDFEDSSSEANPHPIPEPPQDTAAPTSGPQEEVPHTADTLPF
jgi:hypothetical protein